MKVAEHIDWLKESYDFMLGLFEIKKQKSRKKIFQLLAAHMQLHTHATGIVLIFVEDELTGRVLAANPVNYPAFVADSDVLQKILSEEKITTTMPHEYGHSQYAVFLPVNEPGFKAAVVLLYDVLQVKEEYQHFLRHVHAGLKDIARFLQMLYSLEVVDTRFNTILETIPQGVVFVDDKGRNAWVNKKGAQILGVKESRNKPNEVEAAMEHLRGSAVNKEEILKEGLKLFSSPNQSVKDWKWVFGNPVKAVYNVSCTPAVSENISGRLWVFTDITFMHIANEQLQELNEELAEKRREAEDKSSAKSDFLANMSHEIRTPMNGVIGMTSLLMGTHLTEEQRDYIDTIRISGETLLSLINDILDFSKIEAGKMELEFHPFSVGTVIEETYDILSVKANEKGLDLLYIIEPDVPGEIISDIIRLRQVLVNLVSNGIKFTDKGEILVSVKVLNREDDIYNIEFTVKDTGIGISKDKYHRLFESFSQADTSTTRKYGGTGLGLAICRRIISMMGGDIRVESEFGKGASFIFNIKVSASRQIKLFQSAGKNEQVILKDKKVLILDDNRTNLKILKAQCEMWDMLPYIFDDPEEAIATIEKNKYDLAIIDMMLTGVNGIDVARTIRSKYPGKKLPMILFSSAGQISMNENKSVDLFASVLYKPTRHVQIQKTIIDVLGAHIAEAGRQEITPVYDQAMTSTISILVAEDNDINQKLIKRALEKIGFMCDIVPTGLGVLANMENKHYDLIFMDVMMPDMDGYEATRKIIEQYAEAQRPVIIAMTANAMEEDRRKALSVGMDDYVCKPFRIQEIKDTINKWFPGHLE